MSDMTKQRGLTYTELAAVITMAALVVLLLMPAVTRAATRAEDRGSCQNNLKQMGMAFKMRAGENRGAWPGPAQYRFDGPHHEWLLSFHAPDVYPKYMTHGAITVCPSDPHTDFTRDADSDGYGFASTWGAYAASCEREDRNACEVCCAALLSHPVSYVYVPWATAEAVQVADVARAQAEALAAARDAAEVYPAAQIATAGGPETDVLRYDVPRGPLPQSDWGRDWDIPHPEVYQPLAEGVERFFITDINNPAGAAQAQASIPVMWDATGDGVPNHAKGSNVLFLDGHVEFQSFGMRDGEPLRLPTWGHAPETSAVLTHTDRIAQAFRRAGGMG
jgi:prepilin-type processing-associated H-X9-DG protein